MSGPVAFACPHCGARLHVQPRQLSVLCKYCGTNSLLGAPPAPPPRPRAGSSISPGLVVGLGAGASLMLTVLSLVAVRGCRASEPVATAPVAPTLPTPTGPRDPAAPRVSSAPAVAPPSKVVVRGGRRLLWRDLDGDGQLDFVVLTHDGKASGPARYRAYSGRDRRELWATPAIESTSLPRAASSPAALYVDEGKGKLSAYDMRSGVRTFSTELGDVIDAFCAEGDGAAVVLHDERRVQVDPRTGKQSPRSGACVELLADVRGAGFEDVRDRSDATAPEGVKGIRCGSVRVMGSQNFVVPDACAGKAPPGLSGVDPSRIWIAPTGTLVVGSKRPGTPTPMLAFAPKGKRVAWSHDVPDGNPLDARSQGALALAGEVAVASFSRSSAHSLTAFGLADGERRWLRELPDSSDELRLTGTAEVLYVGSREALWVLDPATGKSLQQVGRDD